MNKEGYNIVKEGYLLKESLHLKQFRKRWIVLNKGYMDCYKDNASHNTSEALDLSMFYDVRISTEGKPYQFELMSNKSNTIRIFVASSTNEMNDWVTQIKACMIKKNNHKTDKIKHKNGTSTVHVSKHIHTKSKSVSKSAHKTKSNGKRPMYSEQDIKNLSVWYSDEVKNLTNKHTAEKNKLVSKVNKLQNELNNIKYNQSKEIEKKLRKASKSKDKQYDEKQKELKLYINKLEKEFDALQNEISNDMKYDHDNNEMEGKIDHNNKPKQPGLLIFQRDCVSHKQLNDITKYYQSNMDRAPKFLFGENDMDKNRKENMTRKHFDEESFIMGKFDTTLCFGITTKFYGMDMPTLYGYRTLINKQFATLKQYLLNGNDIIIALPSKRDINNNDIDTFYKFNKQIIYHKIGIVNHKNKNKNKLQLPFSFIECIQNKIDELTKYAYSTQIVQCYIYNKREYKQIYNTLSQNNSNLNMNLKEKQNMKSAKKELQFCVIWQWKNNINKWISYDHKTSQKIEALPVNGIYEYTTNSFVAKITKKSGMHINVATEAKREIKRVKKRIDIANMNAIELKESKTSVIEKEKEFKQEMISKARQAISIRENSKKKKGIHYNYNYTKQTEKDKKYIVNWQRKDDNNRWISYAKEISHKIESLKIRQSLEYKHYKIIKETRNFAVEIDLETLKKRHVRQTRKEITAEYQKFINENENEKKQMKSVKSVQTFNIWQWQWMDHKNIWQTYDNEISQQIENLKIKRCYNFTYWADKQHYKITKLSNTKAIQININNNIEMNVRRIEKYPKYWNATLMTTLNYYKPILIDILHMDLKVKRIKHKFFKCVNCEKYEIIKIEGIQNQMLFDKYLNEKESMVKLIGEKKLNERELFSEMTNGKIMKLVCMNGFNYELNQNKFSKYGKGIYFRKNANSFINDLYRNKNGIYKMFLCMVICGESIIGDTSYKLNNWPKKPNNETIYDSLVNDEWNKSIFVIHKNKNMRAYPTFIVHFKKKDEFYV